jgi:hypothetical protein
MTPSAPTASRGRVSDSPFKRPHSRVNHGEIDKTSSRDSRSGLTRSGGAGARTHIAEGVVRHAPRDERGPSRTRYFATAAI